MKHNFKTAVLLFVGLLLTWSCEKDDNTNESVNQYKVPSIERAKTYFNEKINLSSLETTDLFRNGDSSLDTDWDKSKSKAYKEEPQETLDILYTPIYLPTSGKAKSFIGSVEMNGDMQSKIFILFYKQSTNDTAFSGFMLIYNLDGIIEYAYEYDDGQRISEGLPNLVSNTLNRTDTGDCESPFDSLGCLLDWVGGDWFGLDGFIENDVVEVIAVGDSSTGGPISDSGFGNPGFSIPALDEGIAGTNGSIEEPWWLDNTVSANPLSIIMALELGHVALPEAEWLLNQASQEQLTSIANFLNANRAKDKNNDSIEDSGLDPNQMTEISQEALDFAISMINYLMNNPNVTLEYDLSNQINSYPNFDTFDEVEDFFENSNNSSSHTVSVERDNFTFNFLMPLFSYAIEMDVDKEVPDGNSCDCIEILDVKTYISGNETITSYTEIGEYWTDISSEQNTIKVSIKGKITTGLNIDGFPWKRSKVYTFYVVYNHSTGNIITYGYDLQN
ncbi:hypothetical protein [uncultured Psychroserpens sp.]|uniref:hypothetical protein n=1 Tax=uncultured Psychroserpens sp. TaxID=255436 RepID=UPI00260DAA9E|nr:hypothetical protein [uncultured Psychroserpens sp.]